MLISNSARRQHSKLYWHLWQICKGEGKKKERKWRKQIKQMRDGADIHPKKGGPIDCGCQDKLPSTNRFSGWSLLVLGGACEHEDRRCCCSESLEQRQNRPHDNGMTSAEKCHWGQTDGRDVEKDCTHIWVIMADLLAWSITFQLYALCDPAVSDLLPECKEYLYKMWQGIIIIMAS